MKNIMTLNRHYYINLNCHENDGSTTNKEVSTMKKIFQFKQIIISVIPGERSPELWLTNPWLIDRRVF